MSALVGVLATHHSKEDHEDEQEEPEEEEPSGKAYGDMQMSGQPYPPHVQHSIHLKVFECICFPWFSELVKRNLLQRPTQSPHARHREPRRRQQLAIERRLGLVLKRQISKAKMSPKCDRAAAWR